MSAYLEFSKRFDSIATRNYARPEHAVADFNDAAMHIAKVFYRDALADRFADFNKLRDSMLNGDPFAVRLLGFDSPVPGEREFALWKNAITSWLAVKYPDRISEVDKGADWMHKSIRPDAKPIPKLIPKPELEQLTATQRQYFERFTVATCEKYGVRMKRGQLARGWRLPDDAIYQDESRFGETVGDDADRTHRLQRRAAVYSTACRILDNLIVPAKSTMPAARVICDASRQQVIINGKAEDVTVTGCKMVTLIVEANGKWVGGPFLKNTHFISRPDKILKELPRLVQDCIEAQKPDGYRLRHEFWSPQVP